MRKGCRASACLKPLNDLSELLLQVSHDPAPERRFTPVGLQYPDGKLPVFQQDRAVDRRIFQRERNSQIPLHQAGGQTPVMPVLPLNLSRLHDRSVKRHDPVEHGGRHKQTVADGKAVFRGKSFHRMGGLMEIVIVLQDHINAVPG